MSRTPDQEFRPDQFHSFDPPKSQSNETGQGDRGRRSGSENPTRSVRLGRTEAARWLEQIRDWEADSEQKSEDLEALRDALEDACWIARWKRQEVILQLCPGVVAGLLEMLVRLHVEDSREMADALETMVRKLSGQ
jgi:hypothetical protein